MSKHYTKDSFAAAILRWIPRRPKSVLDPAVGGGALLYAASKRWPGVRLFGFDVSTSALRLAGARLPSALLIRRDALAEQWHVDGVGRHCLVLCNPPFAGHSREPVRERLDVRFAFRALTAVRRDGHVVVIVPNSTAAYPAFRSLRKEWLQEHRLLTALRLPETAFERTEANAVALIFSSHGTTDGQPITFASLAKNGRVVQRITTRLGKRSLRLDPGFYLNAAWVPRIRTTTIPLKSIAVDVRRGAFVGHRIIASRQTRPRVIHITDLASGGVVGVPTVAAQESAAPNVARGCFLVARVGAGLWRKSALYLESKGAIATDCVYIIRTPSLRDGGYLAAMFATRYVQTSLRRLTRGVTVPILSKADLLTLRIPWLSDKRRTSISKRWQQANTISERQAVTRILNAQLETRHSGTFQQRPKSER